MYLCILILTIVVLSIILGNIKQRYKENFNSPSVSSAEDVSTGASELYGWGYTPIKAKHKKHKKSRKCPGCENIYVDEIDICNLCQNDENSCKYADITKNVDIDKYVLKSSVPPCPDLTEYAKKNQIPPIPFNKNEWIRKSDIPPCPRINKNDWVRKDEIEPLIQKTKCQKCPVCPVAPLVPPCKKDKLDNIWKPKLSEMNEAFTTEPMVGSFRF